MILYVLNSCCKFYYLQSNYKNIFNFFAAVIKFLLKLMNLQKSWYIYKKYFLSLNSCFELYDLQSNCENILKFLFLSLIFVKTYQIYKSVI